MRGTHGGRSGMRVVSVVEDRFRLRRRAAALLPKGAARKCVRLGIHHAQTSFGDEEKKFRKRLRRSPRQTGPFRLFLWVSLSIKRKHWTKLRKKKFCDRCVRTVGAVVVGVGVVLAGEVVLVFPVSVSVAVPVAVSVAVSGAVSVAVSVTVAVAVSVAGAVADAGIAHGSYWSRRRQSRKTRKVSALEEGAMQWR